MTVSTRELLRRLETVERELRDGGSRRERGLREEVLQGGDSGDGAFSRAVEEGRAESGRKTNAALREAIARMSWDQLTAIGAARELGSEFNVAETEVVAALEVEMGARRRRAEERDSQRGSDEQMKDAAAEEEPEEQGSERLSEKSFDAELQRSARRRKLARMI